MISFDPSKFDFSDDEIHAAAAAGKLLSAEIEFNRSCNYRCPYCYAAGFLDGGELPSECAESVIRQAAALGARKIVVLGGEPLLCRELRRHIGLITSLGMGAEIFTNGSLVTAEWAEFFREHGCRVVVKLNSLRPEVQEKLTGVPGALDKAMKALDLLREAGFSEEMLAASSVISSENESEVAGLWRYLRARKVRPYLEILTPQGRLLENRRLEVDPHRLKEIFDEIAASDRELGFRWEPQPPLVGAKCLRHQYSCVVNVNGDVTPCVGVTVTVGNVFRTPLEEILRTSNVMNHLKNYRQMLKGPCAACERAENCYGCRGAAYQLTGDYLASDPLCWKNCDELLNRPPALPCDAGQWIPHRPPMTMAKRIVEVGEWSLVEADITADNRFLRNGRLDPEALPEIVAQACAAVSGFTDDDPGIRGLLTGMRNVRLSSDVAAGERLTVAVRGTARIDNYHTIDFRVTRRDGGECASGELSICRID